MTHLIDVKYKVYVESINGLNIEISKRRNYINTVTHQVRHNIYWPNMIKKALVFNKELTRLKIIRNQMWIIIMNQEIKELSISMS